MINYLNKKNQTASFRYFIIKTWSTRCWPLPLYALDVVPFLALLETRCARLFGVVLLSFNLIKTKKINFKKNTLIYFQIFKAYYDYPMESIGEEADEKRRGSLARSLESECNGKGVSIFSAWTEISKGDFEFWKWLVKSKRDIS